MPYEISLKLLKLETSNFLHKLVTCIFSLVVTDCPSGGRGQGHVTHFYILCPGHIIGADEASHFKFCLQIECKEYYHYTC